jgi:hypothetical protein
MSVSFDVTTGNTLYRDDAEAKCYCSFASQELSAASTAVSLTRQLPSSFLSTPVMLSHYIIICWPSFALIVLHRTLQHALPRCLSATSSLQIQYSSLPSHARIITRQSNVRVWKTLLEEVSRCDDRVRFSSSSESSRVEPIEHSQCRTPAWNTWREHATATRKHDRRWGAAN